MAKCEEMRNNKNGRMMKKAESAFISYILLTALMVFLGTFVLVWTQGYVKTSSEDVKRTVYNYNNCDSISISIDSVCKDSEYLYINVTNRNDLRINALVIQVMDAVGNPQVEEENITIKPGKQKELKIGFDTTDINLVQALPIMHKDNLRIICSDKLIGATIIDC